MEQKFKDFLNKYNGTFVEKVDASSPNQCFDLAVAWCEWLGFPLSIFSGLMYAYEIWSPSTTLAMAKFDYILNTPDAVPLAGDIVVWGKGINGTAGHVGIATGWFSDTNHFQCFEQNDPAGSNSHLKDYNYKYVLGWLRLKKVEESVEELKRKIADLQQTEKRLQQEKDDLQAEMTLRLADCKKDCLLKIKEFKNKVLSLANNI